MNEDHKKIEKLFARLQYLDQQQERFGREIDAIKHELNKLKAKTAYPEPPEALEEPSPLPIQSPSVKNLSASVPPRKEPKMHLPKVTKETGGLEKYIGENLFSKLGIAIIIIGVGIGAKFAIDNDLISPVVRVILGYLIGGVLLGLAIRLQAKYHTYSAVLLSGAMAIFYFMTYISHSFYEFLPDLLAFGAMVAVTGMTVAAAVYYKEQIIALIGQVGAYAIPFLLSDGSDDMRTFFTYMAIINVGILFVAFRQYWKLLYVSAFALSWLFLLAWIAFGYDGVEDFTLAFSFTLIFFGLFYLTFLAYKLLRAEKYQLLDVFLLLSNSFVFFGIGYGLWSGHPQLDSMLGLFAILNGIIHLIVGALIYVNDKADKNVLLLVIGLVVLFFTLAIPIQLDGNWVTLLWLIEGALLFVIGRLRSEKLYEKIAYPILTLSFLSLLQDWGDAYWTSAFDETETFNPIFNLGFFTSCIAIAVYGTVQWLKSRKVTSFFKPNTIWASWGNYVLPAFLIVSIYSLFGQEIAQYWSEKIKLLKAAEGERQTIQAYQNLAISWRLAYTLFFLTVLALVNDYLVKARALAWVNLVLKSLLVLFFLIGGLQVLTDLRETYHEYPDKPLVYFWVRYIVLGLVGGLLYQAYRSIEVWEMKNRWGKIYDISLHLVVLLILSNEWLNWGTSFQLGESYKLGLSILWGLYALFLIVLGIWRNKAYLRIGAIGLFGITLLKLFFYDIAHLPTLPKTIIFLALGSLLLLISFLYNKYRSTLFEQETGTQ
ncbi:MAG: DUF2339 domain-containing protein [Saprospiraceae bacterium]|nr:DUF2339 domain-containing protein [Saprospiraceae bacterium]